METDGQLRDAISRYESHAVWGGVAVIAGLLLEALLAYIFPVGTSAIGNWGPVVADVFIAGGVVVEIYFSRKASDKSHELQRRTDTYLAEANARTETERLARVRIERELAPRYLSAEQYQRITEKIRPFAGTPFSLRADLTAEPVFMDMISALLGLAGRWESTSRIDPSSRATRTRAREKSLKNFPGNAQTRLTEKCQWRYRLLMSCSADSEAIQTSLSPNIISTKANRSQSKRLAFVLSCALVGVWRSARQTRQRRFNPKLRYKILMKPTWTAHAGGSSSRSNFDTAEWAPSTAS